MLIIDDICIGYKTRKEVVPVIRNLSLEIGEGHAVVIVGPSGCGKSTLINALAGILSISCGKISFIMNAVSQPLSPKTHKIGMIPQNCGLLPWKTVSGNCMLPLKIRHEAVTAARKREIDGIYEALGILGLLDRYPGELSGGQAQRTALARAFIMKPDLLLMDEPFTALDEITRDEARELFFRVWEMNRPTTILVTHSIEEALYLGDTVIVMGHTMGDIKHMMKNQYFGILYPDSMEYLETKKLLRQKLKRDSE